MIFGVSVNATMLITLGLVALSMVIFQLLVGLRKIHFKGKTHRVVHKWGGWVLFGVALVHGFLGFVYATGVKIG